MTGADVTRGKPDPQVFLIAAERLGVPVARCAVVEDAVHGITAAQRAGMAAIALTGTLQRDELAAADAVVDSLRQLSPERIRARRFPCDVNGADRDRHDSNRAIPRCSSSFIATVRVGLRSVA